MRNEKQTAAYIIARFFRVYLPGERGYSQTTISSYRDTFKQFLLYCQNSKGIPAEKLQISDFSRDTVVTFLTYLENEGKAVSTRNQRLAAIKCFFSYIQYEFPDYLDVSRSILQIRMKKQPEATVNYMSVDGVAAILRQPNMHLKSGYRDAVILALLYDSGARVSELANVRIGDVRIETPATIILHGKGSKDRIVPLSSKTADLIQAYLTQEKMTASYFKNKCLFANRGGEQLTRAGIAYILKKYVNMARLQNPDVIPERFSPHCMRHSKAMHLLQAGVAIIYIRDFLGHNSVKTTEVYAKADGKSKRAALDEAYADVLTPEQKEMPLWNDDASLMDFLSELCKG